jgi:hypothetical protein
MCRLDLEQELLLRAATSSGSGALRAFEAWRASADLDAAIDSEALALMPLLYETLRKAGLDEPFMGRLKGIRRRTWYENQILLESAREGAACLAKAGVAPFLVGDLPLALTHYDSLSARRVGRVDIVVPPRQARLAADLLGLSGWAAGSPLRDEEIAYNHVKRFVGPAGQLLHLHWHFLEAASSEAADRVFWASGQESVLDRMPVRHLSSTALLLHLLLGGSSLETERSRLWIADALVVMRGAVGQLDWDRMTEFAVHHRLAFRLRRKFGVLSGYGASVPESALRALRKVKISIPESVDSIVLRRPSRNRGRIAVWRCSVLADYLRSDRQASLAKRLPDFSHFVRHRWGLKGRREILPLLVRQFRRTAAPEWS